MNKIHIFTIISISLILLSILYYCLKTTTNADNNSIITSNIKDTVHYSLDNIKNGKIITFKKYIKDFDGEVAGHSNSNIYYNININNINYNLYRYPDFRKRSRPYWYKSHSKDYFFKYLSYFKQHYLNHTDNFILDFNGWHGVFDNKVRLWINLKNTYSRDIANKIMCKTYLFPGDKQEFIKDYKKGNKFIMKNSFGGARTALKITNSYDEIMEHFDDLSVDSGNCVDAVEHSKRKYNIVQVFNEPDFLIKGRKVGIRLFLVIIIKNGVLKGYVYKDGYTYYSTEKYDKLTTDLDANVVGCSSYTSDFIEKYNLPNTFIEFKKYLHDNHNANINHFEKTLIEYVNKFITSNLNDINSFTEYKNIHTFSIYAMDIEFDKDMNPSIYEANFYFDRRNTLRNNRFIILKKLINNMYSDIYVKMGYSNNSMINGFLGGD